MIPTRSRIHRPIVLVRFGCHQWRHREQAEHLVARERKKPKQASLRRAVAAYYALFHLLVGDGPTQPPGLSGRIQRAFDHSDMRTVLRPGRWTS